MPNEPTPTSPHRILTAELSRHLEGTCAGCAGYQRLAELVWYLQNYPGAEPHLVAQELASAAELIDDGAQHLLSTTRVLAEIHWRLASGVRP